MIATALLISIMRVKRWEGMDIVLELPCSRLFPFGLLEIIKIWETIIKEASSINKTGKFSKLAGQSQSSRID